MLYHKLEALIGYRSVEAKGEMKAVGVTWKGEYEAEHDAKNSPCARWIASDLSWAGEEGIKGTPWDDE
jgi:hypothetical protein